MERVLRMPKATRTETPENCRRQQVINRQPWTAEVDCALTHRTRPPDTGCHRYTSRRKESPSNKPRSLIFRCGITSKAMKLKVM